MEIALLAVVILLLLEESLQAICAGNQGGLGAFSPQCSDPCDADSIQTIINGVSKCTQCTIDKFLIPNPSKTSCVCATNFYQNSRTNSCEPCHVSCGTCFGSTENECSSCNALSNRIFNPDFRSCFCAQGYIDNASAGDYNCKLCPRSCILCKQSNDDVCLKCQYSKAMF